MSQDWNIKPRGTACGACQKAFEDGQAYITRLAFEGVDYTRDDYCEPCWAAEAARKARYSSWKGIFKVPPPEPERRVRKETAETLLRELLEANNPARKNAIYILAVMLERQRVMVEREVRTGDSGERLVVYEHRKTGETFVLIDPQLKLTEIEPVQEEIMALLGGQVAAVAPPEPPPPAAAPSSATPPPEESPVNQNQS